MLEQLVTFLQSADIPIYIILFIGFITAYTENILPPIPGDSILLFLGASIAFGKVDFISLLLASTLGSSLGFTTSYFIGKKLGMSILVNKRFRFVSDKSINKVKVWFNKYGWWIIILNRFLSGTRAVISFFAGISHLNFFETLVFSTISSLIWNSVLLYLGKQFGSNWQLADHLIHEYSVVVSILIGVLIAYFVIRHYIQKNKKSEDIEG